MQRSTKVLFKNVPLYVPDIEILNLCSYYGNVENSKVIWDKTKVPGSNFALPGSNRYVNMVMNHGAVMNNYYWLEGPLPGDPGRRVLVLHPGQQRQCSHCLQWEDSGCKGGGNGKLCKDNNEPRGKMFSYMDMISKQVTSH